MFKYTSFPWLWVMGISYHEVVQKFTDPKRRRRSRSNRARQTLEPLTNKWPKGCLGSRWRQHENIPHGSHGGTWTYLYLNHQVPPTEIWRKYPKKNDGFGKMDVHGSPVCEISGAGRYAPFTLLWSDFLRVTHMAGKPLKNSRMLHLKITSKWTKHIIFSELWVPKPLIFRVFITKRSSGWKIFGQFPPKAREVGRWLVKLHPFVNMLDKPMTDPWDNCVFTYIWLIFRVNVGEYTIHGFYPWRSSGILILQKLPNYLFQLPMRGMFKNNQPNNAYEQNTCKSTKN